MNISIFIYTPSEEYAIIKMKEVINKLEISDEYSYSVEPYWKFSDMFEAVVQSQSSLNVNVCRYLERAFCFYINIRYNNR